MAARSVAPGVGDPLSDGGAKPCARTLAVQAKALFPSELETTTPEAARASHAQRLATSTAKRGHDKHRKVYRCRICARPKAGHVCPLESRSVRRCEDERAGARRTTPRGAC